MADNFWDVFRDTGDIFCYLLWKADSRAEKLENEDKAVR